MQDNLQFLSQKTTALDSLRQHNFNSVVSKISVTTIVWIDIIYFWGWYMGEKKTYLNKTYISLFFWYIPSTKNKKNKKSRISKGNNKNILYNTYIRTKKKTKKTNLYNTYIIYLYNTYIRTKKKTKKTNLYNTYIRTKKEEVKNGRT